MAGLSAGPFGRRGGRADGVRRAATFRVAGFLVGAFLVGAFRAVGFLVGVFRAAVFLAGVFRVAVFLAGVPPRVAPRRGADVLGEVLRCVMDLSSR